MKPESISATGKVKLALAFVFGLVAVATPWARAQTFSVVHSSPASAISAVWANDGFAGNSVRQL